MYLNLTGDEGGDRVRSAFGEEKYQRLAAIKAGYDSGNVIRGKQYVKPASTGDSSNGRKYVQR